MVGNVTQEKQTRKTQEDFIAQLAHEMRTPLTSIRAYTEMLLEGDVTDAETQKEFYNTIRSEVGRLSRLIDNLLDLSRIDTGGLLLNRTPVKSDWLVEDCLPAVEASAREKHVALKVNIPDRFPTLRADKKLMKVALVNVLGNAVKYTPENGEVTFRLREEGDSVMFQVTDTGSGIAEKDLPHIFERFYRAAGPNAAGQKGSGLGLAVASEIVRLHGGRITVKSRVGHGSEFTLLLPKEETCLA